MGPSLTPLLTFHGLAMPLQAGRRFLGTLGQAGRYWGGAGRALSLFLSWSLALQLVAQSTWMDHRKASTTRTG